MKRNRFLRASVEAAAFALVLTAAGLGGVSSAARAATANFVPHRAVYDMRLSAAHGSQSATAIGGRMEFTWQDICDGWSVDYQSRMRVTFADSGTRELAWNYSAWESDDGTRFRFFLRRFSEGQETLRTRGEARLKHGQGGTATYSAPVERTVELPPDTLFPKEHSELLLETARTGGTLIWRHVFDGTGEDNGLFGVNAAVVKEVPPNTDLPIQHPLLAETRSWRTVLAYFPADDTESLPESEQSMRFFENGVAGTLTIDYGSFVVTAKLSELEALDRPECR